MLTINAIRDLATCHALVVTTHYPALTTRGTELPKASSLTVWFKGKAPAAWETLMSDVTEVPVSLHGTRAVTGSGATDDRLLPAYAALLPGVNERRAAVGLGRVHG